MAQKKQDIEFNKHEDSMKLLISQLKRKLEKVYEGGGAKAHRKASCQRQDDGAGASRRSAGRRSAQG